MTAATPRSVSTSTISNGIRFVRLRRSSGSASAGPSPSGAPVMPGGWFGASTPMVRATLRDRRRKPHNRLMPLGDLQQAVDGVQHLRLAARFADHTLEHDVAARFDTADVTAAEEEHDQTASVVVDRRAQGWHARLRLDTYG